MTNDPVLNRFSVYLHRTLIFIFLWLLVFCAISYKAIDGASMTLRDWWELFVAVTGPNCPPALTHPMAFIAIVSMLPVAMIFLLVGGWWRRQGLASLRAQSGSVER
jgi:hypothetical protein